MKHSSSVYTIILSTLMCIYSFLFYSCAGKQKEVRFDSPEPDKKTGKVVLVSPLAGTWYPDNKDELEKELLNYLKQADDKKHPDIRALVLPHAGYRYSGKVAAACIKQIAGKHFRRVIIMGPAHQYNMPDTINIPPITHYKTPLGEIRLDADFIEKLKASPFVTNQLEVDRNEHSVQIELPLIQLVLKDFALVPIVVGRLSASAAYKIGQLLLSMVDDTTLVIASSDFCHYGENYGYIPFRDNIRENIRKLDMRAFDFIRDKDPEGFSGYIKKTGTTICGESPISILLSMCNQKINVHKIAYDTSGAVTGDFKNSVSYLSIAFSGVWDKEGNPTMIKEKLELTESDKQNLLKLARSTLAYYLKHERLPGPEETGIAITDPMKKVMGAFVTLTEHSELRGCIGEITPHRALYLAVMDHAVNAGIHDPRFLPVAAGELKDIEFEISALTPPQVVSSAKEIVIGKHGIVLSKNGRSAVFLPQVAPEQGWNLEQTLSHLTMKAGLSKDSWKEGASFQVFEAIVFSEGDEKK